MLSKFDVDHGTPERDTAKSVTLQIDGMTVTVPAGTSLMRAASGAGVKVPKLCATDSIEPFGSCRLCLVEIDGRKGYPASCTTNCEDGMVVRTQSSKLADIRRGVMELYISDHPLDCLTCSANGNCELQDMARCAVRVFPVVEREVFDLMRTFLAADRAEEVPAVLVADDAGVFDGVTGVVRAKGGRNQRRAGGPSEPAGREWSGTGIG